MSHPENPYNNYAIQWTESMRSGKVFSHRYIEKPAMLKKLPELTGRKVLCIGSGSGDECQELSNRGATVVGIDNANELVKIARESFPSLEFHVMDMEETHFSDETFDLAYSSLVLHYKKDWEKHFGKFDE